MIQNIQLIRFFRPMIALIAIAFMFLAASTTQGARRADEWDWKMPSELYKQLNHLQRSRLDKAGALFKKADDMTARHKTKKDQEEAVKNFKTSALEWRKIRVQIGDALDDSTLAYVIFMEGYSLHLGNNRIKACQIYTEVSDYFPDEIWITVPALYYRGVCYMDNGDVQKGYKSFQDITKDKDYMKHKLAAGAIRRLADNHWANKEFEAAAKYWLQAYESYKKSNKTEASKSASNLKAHYVFQHKFTELEAFLAKTVESNAPGEICDAYASIMNTANAGMHHNNSHWKNWYYYRFFPESTGNRLMGRDRSAIYEWFEGKEDMFKGAGKEWNFHLSMLNFAVDQKSGKTVPHITALMTILKNDKRDLETRIDQGSSFIQALIKAKRRTEATTAFSYLSVALRAAKISDDEKEQLAARMMGTLARFQMVTEAESLLNLYKDLRKRYYAQYNIAEWANLWPKALVALDRLESLDIPSVLLDVRRRRASIYHTKTREYEKAIKAYQELADPPNSVINMAHCYRALKQNKMAHTKLSEISAMFPKSAAAAVLQRAEWYREDGEHKLAVSLYRQIMVRFKGTSQASQAHQQLEDYGVETGGGFVEDAP